MTHHTFIAMVAATAVFCALPASAQDAAPRGDVTRSQAEERAGRMFERMDANRDGKLDQADQQERQRARFDRLDTNNNGALSLEEFTAVRERRTEQRGPRATGRGVGGMGMRGVDSDGDGAISRDEFATGALARFDRADTNKDGTLSAGERGAGPGTVPRRQGRTEG